MVNAVNVAAQTVNVNAPVLYASTRIQTGGRACCAAATHQPGTGVVNLRKPGIYEVTFNGNVATAAAGTAVVNIQTNGVNIPGAQATVTTAVDNIYSVSLTTLIQVCCNETVSVSISNGSTVALTVANADITVTKLC